MSGFPLVFNAPVRANLVTEAQRGGQSGTALITSYTHWHHTKKFNRRSYTPALPKPDLRHNMCLPLTFRPASRWGLYSVLLGCPPGVLQAWPWLWES